MKQKFLAFEYLLAISFSLQILFPEFFTRTTSIMTFLSLTLLKSKYEGLRATLPIYILVQTGLILCSSHIVNMLLTLITFVVLSYFPVYEFPETKGPFFAGYRDLTLNNTLKVSAFYPTLEKTTRVQYKTSEDGWVKIYDIMRSYPGHFIPKYVYKLAFGFLEHLDIGVNLNAKIISSKLLGQTEKFPVIVFSHGLSANRNLYTGFARQWASYGYIVFCIDHEEPIFLEFKDFDVFRAQRKAHLDARCDSVGQVIDFIQDPKEMRKFFDCNTLDIDYQRLSLAGHSFGSATVAEYSAKDSRVTGALIMLDPWLFPASDEALKTPAKRPVLVLRTESFAAVIEEFKVKEKIQTLVQANKEFCDETLCGYFKNTTHNSFCDLIVHMPMEMKLFGIIEDIKDVEEVYSNQTMLSQIFLDLMLYPTGATDVKSKRELVLRAFENYASSNEAKNNLELDCF